MEIGRQQDEVTARVAEGAERDELWRACNEQYSGFDEYVKWLDRTPSVWVLEPAAARTGADAGAKTATRPTREHAAAADDTSPLRHHLSGSR